MKENYRLRKSQEKWKAKARARSLENCDLRKKVKRLEENALLEKINRDLEIELLKDKIKEELLLSSAESKKNSSASLSQKVKVLCIKLLIVGVISFRSVPKILKIIGASVGGIQSNPHFTSVINWTLRAGIGILNNVSPISEPWIAIIDMSNTIGTRKILVVHRVLLSELGKKGKAICLEEAEVVGIKSDSVWNGNTVKFALTEIFLKTGAPVAILKDGGSDLKKGVRLYCEENESQNIATIDDIGHFVANALKLEFENDEEFKKLIELITKGSTKIRQTNAAWALPPKLRTKGRFQGITKLAEWAQDMLAIINGHNLEISSGERALLLKTFSGLKELKPIVEKFILFCEVSENFLALMKNKGLNKATTIEAKSILVKLPKQSKFSQKIFGWLDKHQKIQLQIKMGRHSLLVSSDIIESLFGKFKSIIERSPSDELNKLIYIIPLLCGKRTEEEINDSLIKCSHVEMQEFISQNIPTTLRQKRIKLLNHATKMEPNAGNFIEKMAA